MNHFARVCQTKEVNYSGSGSYKKKLQRISKVYELSDSSSDSETSRVHKTTEINLDSMADEIGLLAPPIEFEDRSSIIVPPPFEYDDVSVISPPPQFDDSELVPPQMCVELMETGRSSCNLEHSTSVDDIKKMNSSFDHTALQIKIAGVKVWVEVDSCSSQTMIDEEVFKEKRKRTMETLYHYLEHLKP